MSQKKYELTEEHRAQLKPWADKWIANAMSTKAMDDEERRVCKEAVKQMYAAANLLEPIVVFVPSPFVLRFAGGFASAIWYLRKTLGKAKDVKDATWNATLDATKDATKDATLDATKDATWNATWNATLNATRDATRNATMDATWIATRDATLDATSDATWNATLNATTDATTDATWNATLNATWIATRDATSNATMDATWIATRDATSNATWYTGINLQSMRNLSQILGLGKLGLFCAEYMYRLWQGGNQWSGFVAFQSFFRHVAKLPDIDFDTKWDCWEKLALHSGPRIVHEKFCMISDRPEILLVDSRNRPHCETGPFCKWRDGTALYSIHGVRVPAWVVESPELITLEKIEAEQNAEVKRVMLERFGMERYIKETGAEVLDKSVWGTLYRKEISGDEPLVMVEVVNSTPEGHFLDNDTRDFVPDRDSNGNVIYKRYMLPVHPELRPLLEPDEQGNPRYGEPQPMTAHAAIASTFGLTADEYSPVYQS